MFQEEHHIFRDVFVKFVAKEITPRLDDWERAKMIPREAWEKMGASGFLCPWLPEGYGGSGADFLYSVIITEELSRAGALSFMTPLHSDIIAPYIDHLGTEEQKGKWLPKCASGEIILDGATGESVTDPTRSRIAVIELDNQPEFLAELLKALGNDTRN